MKTQKEIDIDHIKHCLKRIDEGIHLQQVFFAALVKELVDENFAKTLYNSYETIKKK